MLPRLIEKEAGPLEAGQKVGEFEVGKLLAVGGMGVVYSAIHPVIGKRAAIKVLHPRLCDDEEAIDRFLTEARSVNRIGHPNIVDVFDFGQLSDGRSYMAMEWLAGESLAQRLVRGPLSLEDALAILDQTADALEAAHEKGIVHRDLKPDNIFLVPMRDGRTHVKLLDFGIAKLVEVPGTVPLQSTRPGSIMGTPGYLSPEQARGMDVDGRTDVYALGCVAFEVLTGQTPFTCDNIADMIVAHLEQLPPHVRAFEPMVPRALDDLVLRMLEKDPTRRPSLASIRLACRAQAETPTQEMLLPEPLPEPQPPPPRSRRRQLLLGGLAVAAAVAVGLILVLIPGRGREAAREGSVDPAAAAAPAARVAEPTSPPPEAAPARGTLTVTVEPAAQIVVDGQVVAEDAMRREIAIEPGMHEVILLAPGRTPAVKYVRVNGGAETELSVDLAPVAPPPAPPAVTPSAETPVRPRKGAPASKPKASPKDYMLDPFPKN